MTLEEAMARHPSQDYSPDDEACDSRFSNKKTRPQWGRVV